MNPHQFAPPHQGAAPVNLEYEAQRLRKAMKGLGTDEATIIEILGRRPSHERAAIAQHYKGMFGKDLKDALKSELSGNLKTTCINLCLFLAEFDALQLREAVEGLGTKEQALIDTLVPRNGQQIIAIKEAYTKLYKRNLEADVSSDTSGDFKKVLVALLQGIREENSNPQLVEQDADELNRAGERRLGTDEDVFNRILCVRSFMHLHHVAQVYQQRYGKPLADAVHSETSGSYRDILMAIVNFSYDPANYYAQIFYESMKGLGTNDSRLQRVAINQMEGNLPAIKQAFFKQYGKSLADFIRSDTSGDYRKLLLTMVGEH